jgi:hypothetical protein
LAVLGGPGLLRTSEPMKTTFKRAPVGLGWSGIDSRMRVVRLTTPLQLFIPALIFPSLSKSTRGLTLYPGRIGLALGCIMLAASLAIGILLYGPTGPWGTVLSLWFLGTAGMATLAGALRPTAFVKPICVKCRLLPIIREHEAIHLAGVASEKAVWESMRTRHSVESLSLEGDPAICSFCPIPKRLSEH